MTKTRKRIIVTFAAIIIIVLISVVFYLFHQKRNTPSLAFYSQFTHANQLASYNINVEEVIKEYHSNVIIALEDRPIEPNKYQTQLGFKGIYYIVDKKIVPAFDTTYEEMYKEFGADLSGYGNPVEKYKGMELDDFIKEITE